MTEMNMGVDESFNDRLNILESRCSQPMMIIYSWGGDWGSQKSNIWIISYSLVGDS